MKIVWWKSTTNGQFYFHIRARNGRIVAASEGYKQKAGMMRTIESIQGNVADAEVVEL